MKSTYLYIGLVILLIIGLGVARSYAPDRVAATTKYDTFAQCLTDAGAKFYGAFWCPHCKDQKKVFDNSSKIPYVECSTPDSKGQLQLCADQKIEGYPTWIFKDGEKINRLMEPQELGEKTSCVPPVV